MGNARVCPAGAGVIQVLQLSQRIPRRFPRRCKGLSIHRPGATHQQRVFPSRAEVILQLEHWPVQGWPGECTSGCPARRYDCTLTVAGSTMIRASGGLQRSCDECGAFNKRDATPYKQDTHRPAPRPQDLEPISLAPTCTLPSARFPTHRIPNTAHSALPLYFARMWSPATQHACSEAQFRCSSYTRPQPSSGPGPVPRNTNANINSANRRIT